ncbi:IclR family transcriptional regulator [Mycobacterium sp. 1274756.6]|nr:IclR family transcriptional regulator [Mycobacterium sp. 1274756.6]
MVARVALILGVFDEPGRRLRLDQVAGRTGLPRSSVHRILTQLLDAGLLQHRSDGYGLAGGAGSPLSAAGLVDHARLRAAASLLLDRLHTDTGLVVQLGVLAGGDVVYLDKFSGGRALVPTAVGGRTPAHASALGKTMLAQLPAEEVDAVLPVLAKKTKATIADPVTLHQELARIRARHGLAFDVEELAVGLCSVAAPIRSGAGEIAGLSLTGAVSIHRLHRTAPFVMRAAAQISRQLGGAGPAGDSADTESMLSRVLRTISSDAWV